MQQNNAAEPIFKKKKYIAFNMKKYTVSCEVYITMYNKQHAAGHY